MTHGKDLKKTIFFGHECGFLILWNSRQKNATIYCKGSKIRSDFQKHDRTVHTRVYEQRKPYFAMNKKANELMPQKKICRLGENAVFQHGRSENMKYDEVENTLPEFNTAELGLTPPVNPSCCIHDIPHSCCAISCPDGVGCATWHRNRTDLGWFGTLSSIWRWRTQNAWFVLVCQIFKHWKRRLEYCEMHFEPKIHASTKFKGYDQTIRFVGP